MPLSFSPPIVPQFDFSGYQLVLPSISVGNVGQLSVDLFLASLGTGEDGDLKKLCSVAHPGVLPVVGADPIDDNSTGLMTACELYKSQSRQLLVLQLRSGIASHRKDEFVQDLLQWISEASLKEVVILTGSNAEERIDAQLQGSQLRYLSNQTECGSLSGWQPLEKRDRFPGLSPEKAVSEEDEIFIPGGGFAKKLYLKGASSGLAVTVLMKFCSEGDNTQDAIQLALYLNQWKKWIPVQTTKSGEKSVALKVPISWSQLFGNPVPRGIF